MIELFNIDLLSYTVQTAETAPTHSYTIYWLILLGSMLLSWLVSARMKSRFSEYSQIPIPVTGRQVAEQMLKDNHITDVKVISTPGHLTDHYNPANQTVNLSESVYYSNSIAAAAVADYRPKTVADNKMKKKDGDLSIELERTPDTLSWLGAHRVAGQRLCGFSMETENMVENSRAKLEKKHLDMIAANNLKTEGAGFGVATNVVTLITKDGIKELPLMGKDEVAGCLLDEIAARR